MYISRADIPTWLKRTYNLRGAMYATFSYASTKKLTVTEKRKQRLCVAQKVTVRKIIYTNIPRI